MIILQVSHKENIIFMVYYNAIAETILNLKGENKIITIKLFEHQIKALKDTEHRNRVAYYLDMGLGKTFVASEKAKSFNENIIVIVCQKSKKEDWQQHYKKFYPQYNVIIYNKELDHIEPNTVLIINYDLIKARPQFQQLRNFTLILDESSYIKSEKSKRSKFILKMKPSNVILLSGTPTGGKYEELMTQIKLLGWEIKKRDYWDKYIKYYEIDGGGYPIPIVTGYKNVDELKMKLRQHGAVFMKTEDVITLPETIPYEIKIKSTRNYKTFEKDRLIQIGEKEMVGDNALNQMMYLRQLAAQHNPNKVEKIKELLASTEDRIIIFYNFKEEYTELKKICEKLEKPVSTVNGEIRDLNNYESLENTVVLIQYQAGAMGLNLQKSNKIIYFSLPLSSELFEQSKKRTHRLGQQRTCIYYYLITEKSIEEKILKTLKMRKDYTDKLFLEG